MRPTIAPAAMLSLAPDTDAPEEEEEDVVETVSVRKLAQDEDSALGRVEPRREEEIKRAGMPERAEKVKM